MRGEIVASPACDCGAIQEMCGIQHKASCSSERRLCICSLQLDAFCPPVGMTLLTPLVPRDGQGAWEVISVLAWVNGRTGPKLLITAKPSNAAARRAVETAKREADEDAAESAGG